MEPSAPPRAPGGGRDGRQARSAQEFRAYARDRLIESRLTPNAISMVGLAGNLVAAVLVTQRLFFLAGVAFILGSVMDTLDGRYSRMSGKGTLFGAFLDSTLDRIEEGIVLAAVAGYFAATRRRLRRGDVRRRRARLADGLLHPRPRRGARRRVQGRLGDATGAGGAYSPSAWSSPRAPVSGDFELLAPSIYAIAALTIVTVIQRVWHVRNELSGEPSADAAPADEL